MASNASVRVQRLKSLSAIPSFLGCPLGAHAFHRSWSCCTSPEYSVELWLAAFHGDLVEGGAFLNVRIAADSRLLPAPMNFHVWRVGNEVSLLRFCPGSASFAPIPHAPTIVDQFLPTFHVRVSTNMQNQCNGRSDRPMCTHMLCFLFLPSSGPGTIAFAGESKPNIIELVRYTLLLPHGCGRPTPATLRSAILAYETMFPHGARMVH